jgi:two-component system response regulator
LKHVNILSGSAVQQNPDLQIFYALGANSYIVKPINFDGFAEAMQNLGFYWLLLNQPPVIKG